VGSRFRQLLGFSACALAAATVLAVSAPADGTTVKADFKVITKGLDAAVARGDLDSDTATQYRVDTLDALAVIERIPPGRARELQFVLHEVAVQAKRYDAPRALALFSMLAENAFYFADHPLPTSRIDVADQDGVVYRSFPGQGLQFHPLASFGALNSAVAAKNLEKVTTLSAALVARGEPAPLGTVRYEYWFPFGGGKPPWVSGMAQAVAAQSLARAAGLVDPTLMEQARAAYGLLSNWLVTQLPSGPWIKLYAFTKDVVLNAQLQTVLSLDDYAELSGDAGAQQLADSLQATAVALLPRFDSGFWSYYSLAKDESTLNYHTYVIQLLNKLGQRTGDTTFTDLATRFGDDLTNPPELNPGKVTPLALYPVPADGFRDTVKVALWLSKIARVRLTLAGASRTLTLGHGPHTIELTPGSRVRPGTYVPALSATDLAGNATDVDLAPVTIAWDTLAPTVSATLAGRTLEWSATDPGTPWLRLTLILRSPGTVRKLELGRRGLAGRLLLKPPPGAWDATLIAGNSAGKRTQITLGRLG
jgi:hypothetical protein